MSPSGGRTSHIHDQANVELQHLGKLVMWSDTAPPSDTKVINLFFLNVQMLLMSFNAEVALSDACIPHDCRCCS